MCVQCDGAAGGILYSMQTLNVPLQFRAQKPITAASCIVQIMMHRRDQIKIYQLGGDPSLNLFLTNEKLKI